jgi:amidase
MAIERVSKITQLDAFRIGTLDGHAQAALVRSGELSARELVDAAIVRIEHLQPMLNAVTHVAFDTARQRASQSTNASALAGVPYLLKEGLDYPGMPTRSGSRSIDSLPAAQADDLAQRLDAAGLIPLGKSNAPEFGLLPATESLLYGPARNPWALDRSPGGSSGGAAVAVACGMVPIAHAADGGGSIRIPASCCGVVGLKPSRGGTVRARPPHFIEDLLVGDTLLSRSVRDVAWAVGALRSNRRLPQLRPPARRLRIAAVRQTLHGEAPHPEAERVLEDTMQLLVTLGHDVRESQLPIDGPAIARSFWTIWGYLATELVEAGKRRARGRALEELLEPWTLGLAAWHANVRSADLEQVFQQVAHASANFDGFLSEVDVVLSPVVSSPPAAIGELHPAVPFEQLLERVVRYVAYTPLQNLTGTPAISLPLFHAADGVPIGSMFTARRAGEELLIELACELEQAHPWGGRWPPHSAASALVNLADQH